MNGITVHKKYQTKSYISDALSKYTQEQLVDDLVPNVNYTCELAAYNAATAKAFLMATAHFTTLVGSKWNPSAVLHCKFAGFNGNWSLVTFYKEKLSQAGFTNNLTCVGHEFNFAFLHISILSFSRFGFLYYVVTRVVLITPALNCYLSIAYLSTKHLALQQEIPI